MVYKNLNEIVIDALELHSSYELPKLNLGNPKKRLVVASGNALPTGKIIFKGEEIIFADEGQYKDVLKKNSSIDGAVVISASGKKHAPIIVNDLIDKNLELFLLTCKSDSPAAKVLIDVGKEKNVFVTKSNSEPITYNTSTYLGMILAKTRENSKNILNHIKTNVDLNVPNNLGGYKAYYIMVPPEYDEVREMFVTKFDELFGPKVIGRCYTSEQTRHAKTVVPSDDELFISIGIQNDLVGNANARWNVPLPKDADYAAIIAIGYYIIGKIQSAKPPYFMDNADDFEAFQRDELFGESFGLKVKEFKI